MRNFGKFFLIIVLIIGIMFFSFVGCGSKRQKTQLSKTPNDIPPPSSNQNSQTDSNRPITILLEHLPYSENYLYIVFDKNSINNIKSFFKENYPDNDDLQSVEEIIMGFSLFSHSNKKPVFSSVIVFSDFIKDEQQVIDDLLSTSSSFFKYKFVDKKTLLITTSLQKFEKTQKQNQEMIERINDEIKENNNIVGNTVFGTSLGRFSWGQDNHISFLLISPTPADFKKIEKLYQTSIKEIPFFDDTNFQLYITKGFFKYVTKKLSEYEVITSSTASTINNLIEKTYKYGYPVFFIGNIDTENQRIKEGIMFFDYGLPPSPFSSFEKNKIYQIIPHQYFTIFSVEHSSRIFLLVFDDTITLKDLAYRIHDKEINVDDINDEYAYIRFDSNNLIFGKNKYSSNFIFTINGNETFIKINLNLNIKGGE